MKNYFKKFSIMFVIAFTIVLGCCTSVFADDNMYTNNLIPKMTSNTAPSGQVIYSTEYLSSGVAYNAFNGTANNWLDRWFANAKTGYIGYKFTTPQTINKYTITPVVGDSVSGSVRCSKDWTFEGSNDNYNWNVLDSKINVTNWVNGVANKFTFENKNQYLYYRLNITNINGGDYLEIGEIEMMSKISSDILASNIILNKTSDSINVGQTDTLISRITPSNATNSLVTWTSSNSTVATVDSTGKVTGIKEGQSIITANTTDGSNLSASCTVAVTPKPIVIPPTSQTTSSAVVLNIEPEKSEIKLKETVSANITIDNIKEIAAEDVRIKYDNTKLKFLGMDEVDGIKLVKSENKDGELRLILASKGVTNVANAKKVLLKLNFQGIAVGDALVDVTKGKVSDGITMEKDLADAECGQATIKIDDTAIVDVNNSGEFTLLDLAIDARHLGENPTALPQYNTDQVINGAIDNDDLTKIGEYMLANPNYKFN